MNNKNNNSFLRNAFLYIVMIIAVVTAVQYFVGESQSPSQQLSYTQLIKKIEDGKVKSITYQPNGSIIEVKGDYKKAEKVDNDLSLPFLGGASSETQRFTSTVLHNETIIQALQSASEKANVNIKMIRESSSGTWISYLFSYLPLIGIAIFFIFMMNQGGNRGAMNFGRNRAKAQSKENIKVRFTDVAGAEEEKEELVEIVDFLKNPRKYKALGARIPKGVLLEGPPGTGKTLLAKAVAGEADVPFFSISGSDFVEMFVGVGASRVRDLFEDAKRNAPCIVFIDEIDAVARRRGTGLGGGHDEREQTLNQLLVEMDGFGVNEGIIVMAATNRVDILDPAILRPGRFDRKVAVGRPDVKGREEILKVHVKGKPLAEDVDLHQIARTTPGFSGADLENLMNEAAIHAARNNARFIRMEDIRKSFIKVGIGTEKKSRLVPELERKITAYHEAGHAILFHLLPDVGPVYTVSIIPTGMGAAGYTMPVPENDNVFETKGRMIQEIKVGMGGRIAEELIFDDVTTGASQDIKQVTDTARSMITKFGMSDRLGFINYEENTDEVFLGRDLGHSRSFSEEVASIIDKEVKKLVDDCYTDAKRILTENMDVLHSCANLLLEIERISREEFEALFKNDKAAEENL